MKNHDMYDKKDIFLSYLKNSTEKIEFVKQFSSQFRRLSDPSKPIKIMDIGCHDGTLTLKYVDAILDFLHISSEIHCIDPSKPAIEEFKKKKLPTNYQFKFEVSSVERFCSDKTKLYFDWIILSHALYWTKDLEDIISKLVNKAKHIVIVLRGSRGIYQIQKKFYNLIGNSSEQLYTSSDISNVLSTLQSKYERNEIESVINIPDRKAPGLEKLVAFFLQTTPDRLSKENLDNIWLFLSQFGSKMPHDVSFFWISDTVK